MIRIKVECGSGVQDSIRECIELVKKLGVGTTMEVNGVEIECMPWDSSNEEIYERYLEDLHGEEK